MFLQRLGGVAVAWSSRILLFDECNASPGGSSWPFEVHYVSDADVLLAAMIELRLLMKEVV